MDKQKRNTKTKQLVINVLSESSSALSHEDIEQQLSGEIDRVTIYRILQSFCEDGKVHKIVDENRKTYYALCHHCSAGNHHDNHLHFKCLTCKKILCMNHSVVNTQLPKGYRIADINYLVSGYCPNCQTI